MKYVALIINDIFEDDNLLIIKSKGSQSIQRYEQYIEKELVYDYLKRNEITIDDCEIYTIKNDYKGVSNIEKV